MKKMYLVLGPYKDNAALNLTYGQLAQEIFGTPENPTAGSFYYIDYKNLDSTVNDSILNKITYTKDNSLKNLTIKDFFSQEIIDNFDFEIVKQPNIGKVSNQIDKNNKNIQWDIDILKENEIASLIYKLKLKENYDKNIIDKILPTQDNVIIAFEADNEKGEVASPDASKVQIKVTDTTISKDPIPQAGLNSNILLFSIVLISILVFALTRLLKIKKNNKK